MPQCITVLTMKAEELTLDTNVQHNLVNTSNYKYQFL